PPHSPEYTELSDAAYATSVIVSGCTCCQGIVTTANSYSDGFPTRNCVRSNASNARSGNIRRVISSIRAPAVITYRVLGRRADAAFSITFATTSGSAAMLPRYVACTRFATTSLNSPYGESPFGDIVPNDVSSNAVRIAHGSITTTSM